MNYCPNCGTANRDGSRFCNECGHKLPSKTGIICPMCSHMNPTGNVYCDNCQARLVPATAPTQPPPPPPPPSGSAPIKKGLSLPTKPSDQPEPEPDETPDWLVRLRAAAPKASERPAPPEEAPSEGMPEWMRPAAGDVPDWYQRLAESGQAPGARAEPEPSPEPAEDEMPAWSRERGAVPAADATPDEAPDWLRDFREASAPAEEEGALPDWLSSVATPAEAPSAAPEPEAAQADLPDWLSRIRDETESTDQPSPAAPSEELPDWLSDLRAQAAAPAPPPESQPELPDWLSGIGGEPAPEAGEAPDWLSEPSPPSTPAESADIPDWLTSFGEQPPQAAAPAPAEAPHDEVPDWLSVIEQEAGPLPAETEAAGVPDWLAEIGGPTPEPKPVESAEEVPDWLSALRESQAEPEVTAAPEPQPPIEEPAQASDIPDWLRAMSAVETAAPEVAEAEPAGQDIPDWLRDVQAVEPGAPAGEVHAFVGEEAELAELTESPDWLSDVSRPAPKVAEPELPPAELPAWLRELGPLPTPAQPTEAPFGEAAGEVPGWVRELQPGQATPAFADESGQTFAAELGQPAAGAGLEAATIPTWLQALRPTDVTAAEAALEEAVVETDGLLTGLRNVIPASAFMGQPQGAAAIRHAEVPATDLARAGLFQELLARGSLAPTVVRPGLDRAARQRMRITRWALALILVVLALAPNFEFFAEISGSLFQLGQVGPVVYQGAAARVGQLGAGQRVLMVFDYDPFQAGEMEAIAAAFLTHVTQRGAEVEVASLNPFGPALADRAVRSMTELGLPEVTFATSQYVSGQAVGAQRVLGNTSPDNTSPDLIILLAGSPDAVRVWVEQVRAAGLSTPLVAGVSAGVLPQVKPYLESGQVKGTVDGMMGGLAYQRSLDPGQDSGDDGLDRKIRAETLFLMQLAFAVILLAGLVVSLATRLRRVSR
jgi:hypothetical protein